MTNHIARRLSILLAVTFTLTIACFLVSRVISESEADGIRDAATAITDFTQPANELLATLRGDLRRVDAVLDEIAQQPSSADPERLRSQLERSRATITRSWIDYASRPVSLEERELKETTAGDLAQLQASFEKVIYLLATGFQQGVVEEINAQTRPEIARVEVQVRAMAALNRRTATAAAERIGELRMVSRRWGIVLDTLSAVLALAAAFFVIRLVRRFWKQAAERASDLEHFAGRVAHDIRSPLNAVSFALEFAHRKSPHDPQIQNVLERGVHTIQRVGQLVDGLLVFAIAGKPFAGDQCANVRGVVQGVLEDVKPDAAAKEIEIECELPDPGLSAACSPGVLVSLTSNLLVNAIKYMGDAAMRQISILFRQTAGAVRVEVHDTGPGVPQELRTKIFDPHVRAGGMASGFGLGLATVRRLVEAHGGSVGVQPNVKTGSIFWFELPRWKEELSPPPRGSDSALSSKRAAHAV